MGAASGVSSTASNCSGSAEWLRSHSAGLFFQFSYSGFNTIELGAWVLTLLVGGLKCSCLLIGTIFMQTSSNSVVRNFGIAFALLFVFAVSLMFVPQAHAADFPDYGYGDYYSTDYGYGDYYSTDYGYGDYYPSYSTPSYQQQSYSSPSYSYPNYSYPSYSYPSYNYPTYTTPTYTTQTQTHTVTCPHGYTRNGNTCVPPTQCPSGYTLQNGVCVPPTQCPNGYTLQNGTCVPPQAQCPTNWTLQNNQCVPPQAQCPSGYTLNNGTCQPTVAQCPSGYTLQNGTCVPPQAQCPTNWTLQNNQCVPPQGQCPSGYTLQNNQCIPPQGSCPSGYTLQNGTCQPAVAQCPSGYTLQNGTCVPPQAQCPSGYSFQNGQCVPPTQCPSGYTLSGSTCVPPISQITPASNNNVNTNTNNNVITISAPATPVYQPVTYQTPTYQQYCPSGTTGTYPHCYAQQYDICPNIAGIQTVLPSGYYLQNGNCYQQYTPPVYNNPQNPFITLSALPYTGLDLGPVGTALYWSFLILWCLIAAYLIVVKKVQTRIVRWINTFLFGSTALATENNTVDGLKTATAPQPKQKQEVKNEFGRIDSFIASQILRAR